MSKPRKKFIARCTPTLGAVSIWWHIAAESLMWPMNYGRQTSAIRDTIGGEIAETRNKLVSMALSFENEDREVTHIFWLDDDVICTRGALLQLIHHDLDIVSGVYFTKSPGDISEPLIFPAEGEGTDKFLPGRTYHVWGHGMGLCLIRTEVYKKMQRELNLPLDKYGHPEWYRTTGRVEDIKVVDEVIYSGGTEDLYFLDKANKLGYRPLIDTNKHAFGFHYDLQRHTGYPEKQWKQYENRQPVEWDTPDGIVRWE